MFMLRGRTCLTLFWAFAASVAQAQNLPPPPQQNQQNNHQSTTAPVSAPPYTQTVLSESKFLSILYAEIARRTPEDNALGEGEVTASFHVNAAGRIDKVTIEKTTSPVFAEAVKKILASVEAPSPPGGSMDVGQTFKFHQPASE